MGWVKDSVVEEVISKVRYAIFLLEEEGYHRPNEVLELLYAAVEEYPHCNCD